MTFEMFEQEVLKHLQKKAGNGFDISVEHIRKNNGEVLSGLQIRKRGSKMTPVLYLEEYYSHFELGRSLNFIIDEIMRDYNEALRQMPQEFRKGVLCYDEIKERIIYRLVHYERNKEMLQDCPYIKLYDLAVTFRWVAYTEKHGMGSALITNKEMDLWKVTMQDLVLEAQSNTPRLFPAKIVTMEEVMDESGMLYDRKQAVPMYICTNEMKLNGASVILYPDLLQNFAEKHQRDFYVLPSSIHEVILIPTHEEENLHILSLIVKEANESIVDPEEILSDSIYCYRWKEQRLEQVM